MASYRQRMCVVLFAATAGVTGAVVACTDSYRSASPGGPSGGPGGGGRGGAGGNDTSIGGFGQGGECERTCSNDLKKVINCLGTPLEECGTEEGCVNAECVPGPCAAAEKSKSSYGCDYWALKTAQRSQAQGACFAAFVANTWSTNVHLKVERNGVDLGTDFIYIPSGQGLGEAVAYESYDPNVGLPVGEVAVLFLSRSSGGLLVCPKTPAIVGETGIIGAPTGRGSAFHITTDYPVVAYQIAPYGGGQTSYTSATLLLPTSAWDTNYVAVNAYPASDLNPDGLPALEVVAKEDMTEVTILPKAKIVGNAPVVSGAEMGVPVKYTLNAGEFLQIAQSAELTGSPIGSDKPIGVFGASSCMNVPLEQADCDSAHQQIAPVRATGSEYVAIRHKDRVGPNENPPWRLVGMVDGTQLTWEPAPPEDAPTALNLGEISEFRADAPFVVRSQDSAHPFYLGGYMTGGELYSGQGDPEWVNVIPPSQFLTDYVLFTDPTYPETSLVVVRTPSKVDGSFSDVSLECMGVLNGWQKVGGYEYTRVPIVQGNFQGIGNCINGRHVMRSSNPFGVTVWGWGTTNETREVSYAYPAGAGFQPINEVDIPTEPR